MLVKDVLECQRVVNEFHEKVLKAVIEDYPKFANNVVLGKKYKLTPIQATLDMPITVSNEVLHATVMFSKEDDNTGKIINIFVKEYGKVPVEVRKYVPLNCSS